MRWLERRGWRVLLLALAAALPLLGLGCGGDNLWPNDSRPKVVVSFAPIACFAMNVAGDDAVVKNMMTTSGPHHFNPTDADAKLLRRADVFFVNGLGLDEEVAEKLKRGSGNRKLAVVELGEKIPDGQLIDWGGGPAPGHEGHNHGHHDPHVWLGPDLAVIMVEAIRDQLKQTDASHAAGYDARAAGYVAKLRQLKADGREMLKGKADRRLVTFHESLGYFAKEFGLEIAGVVMPKAGSEPNQQELEKLIDMCVEKKVRVIAVEPQYTANTSARTLVERLKARGVSDAVLVEIDPLETVRSDDLAADWYERKMRANLDALKQAMK